MDFITDFLNVSLYHQNDNYLYNGYGMNDTTHSYIVEASSTGNLSFEYCLSIVVVSLVFYLIK